MSIDTRKAVDAAGRGTWRHAVTTLVDHDRAAATGRSQRSIVDIDRVVALAATHHDEPDWDEVTTVLEHLRAILAHDLELPERRN